MDARFLRKHTAALFLGAVLFVFDSPRAIAACHYDLNGVGYPASCGYRGGSSQRNSTAARPQPTGPSRAEIARRQRVAASHAYNDQGITAYDRGDWAEAVRLFQLSLNNDPGDEVVSHNLARAHEKLNETQQSAIAAGRIRSLVQGYAESVAPTSSPRGLDFDQGSARGSGASGGLAFMTAPGASAAKPAPADCASLGFGDPKVVNACHVPSGLPKSIEDEIPHTPAGDRVRKGFEAIAGHDWKVAVAWFEDALNHDPGNAGIARLVDLARYTEGRNQPASPAAASPRRDGSAQSADVNAAIDRADEAGRIESAEIDALIDEGMNKDLAGDFAAYDRSHAASPAKPAAAASANWGAFFDALFKPAHISHRPGSVAGVRD